MSILTGNNGVVSINSQNLASVKSFSIDIKSATIETTSMGIDAKTYVKGLGEWAGSADVIVDLTNLTGGATAVPQLIGTSGAVGDAPVAFTGYLDSVGSPTGKKFTGNVIVTDFAMKVPHDNMVEATISFTGSGSVTFTA
jgi:hypothetical protein